MPSVTDKRPVPSYLQPLYQNESPCKTFTYENVLCLQVHFHFNQTHWKFRTRSFVSKQAQGDSELAFCLAVFVAFLKYKLQSYCHFFKDFGQENDNEETGETEEEESRDLSRWKVTIPHVIMETKQVTVDFAQVTYLNMSKYFLSYTRRHNSQIFVHYVFFSCEKKTWFVLLGLFHRLRVTHLLGKWVMCIFSDFYQQISSSSILFTNTNICLVTPCWLQIVK